ncbi:MAG: glycosyltransferase, partial [Alphaproteobacteria bacterium]|nr:glycosyltransferase [Alphaproteobacteria bacterium]
MNKPKVSIVVPIYGVEKYLQQCVDSILAQTLKDIEIILVDDGSKDKCPEIVDEYAKKDPRIVAVHQPNGGYGRAV